MVCDPRQHSLKVPQIPARFATPLLTPTPLYTDSAVLGSKRQRRSCLPLRAFERPVTLKRPLLRWITGAFHRPVKNWQLPKTGQAAVRCPKRRI